MLACALVSCLALTGCERKVVADTQGLEKAVEIQLVNQQPDADVKFVDCPGKEIEVTVGKKVRCTYLDDRGDEAGVTVTFTDTAGNFRVKTG
jgi:hypothetical protein